MALATDPITGTLQCGNAWITSGNSYINRITACTWIRLHRPRNLGTSWCWVTCGNPRIHVEPLTVLTHRWWIPRQELHAETELQVVPVNIDLPLQQPATYGASKDTAADTQELLNPPVLPVVPLPPVHELLNEPDTQPVLESSPKHDSSRIYYEVLAPDDSEVLHINHEDIIKGSHLYL